MSSVPTSAVYVFTRDKLRAAGFESSFVDDIKGGLAAWVAPKGRTCAVLLRTEDRWIAALTWAESDYEAAILDFHQQCELFAVSWRPAQHGGPLY